MSDAAHPENLDPVADVLPAMRGDLTQGPVGRTLLLFALPMGVLSAFNPAAASDIATGMNAYLGGLPEPLYALFGTGYLGYTVARQWGKIAGVER